MKVLWITVVVVLVDQLTKVIVLNTMYLGQSIPLIGDWLRFTFTENPGMAFGITFGPRSLVTILSMVATLLIIVYMTSVRNNSPWPYRASLALILGGALGNIVDRVFYGVILGYDSFFVGRVVDFIHVNIWRGYVPDAIPFFGGSYVALFPIWNVADMAIVIGVSGVLITQHFISREEEASAGDAADRGGTETEALPAEVHDNSSSVDRSTDTAPDYSTPTRPFAQDDDQR